MKHLAKSALCGLYKYSGAMRAQEKLVGRSFMTVLILHRVTDEIPPDGLTVSTHWFEGMCRMLQRSFHVVPLREVFRIHQSGEKPPARTVAITFDDCYRDNLFAARTLAAYRLPACFFIPTGFVGTQQAFPWDEGLPPLANLSWDEVREMASLGHEVGSHTVTHPDMALVSEDRARHELVESKATLERELQRPVRWFAYPFGGKQNFREERLSLVAAAGYEGCLSAYGGFVEAGQKYSMLPREAVPYFKSLLNLELHLTRSLDWIYALKRRVHSTGDR